LMIPLSEKEVESSFSEIMSYVSAAVGSLKLIHSENKNNRAEVFGELRRNVRSTHHRAAIRKVFNKVVPVIEFVSIFRV
jgi:hypothetical protein